MKNRSIVRKIIAILTSMLIVVLSGCLVANAEGEATSDYMFAEDFEAATGTGIGADIQNKLWPTYGGEADGGKITVADKTNDATKNYVINGDKSLVLKCVGGDQSLFAIGNTDTCRFSPEMTYTISFLMKAENLPADFNLMLQVMSWNGGNWGDEMYVKSDASGKAVAGNVVKGTGVVSKVAPSIKVTTVSDGIYEVTASFGGADVKNGEVYSSFIRLRSLCGTATTISIDDIKITEKSVEFTPVYADNFNAITGFDEWGVITGSNFVCFPRGSSANPYHKVADLTNEDTKALVIEGEKSLIINKTSAELLESFSFGNDDRSIRFDPEKRYVFTYDLKTNDSFTSDFKMSLQLMSWDAPHYGNILTFKPNADGTFSISEDADGAIIGGNYRKVAKGHYKIAIEFNGMSNKNSANKYSSFMRAIFEGMTPYTVAVDNFEVFETTKPVTDFLPDELVEDEEDKEEDVLITYSKLGDPDVLEDCEKITEIDSAAVAISGSIFNWPFPGGDKNLAIADKNGENKNAVISGNKSVMLNNKKGSAQMTVNPNFNSSLDLKDNKTYVVSFKVKFVSAPKDGLNLTIRTWNTADSWVNLNLKQDGNKLVGTVNELTKQDCNKVAIKNLGNNTYHIAFRFKGVKTSTNCYLYWDMSNGVVSLDDFALYESNGNPSLALVSGDPSIPATGDSSNLMLYTATAVLSLGALLVIAFGDMKKKSRLN